MRAFPQTSGWWWWEQDWSGSLFLGSYDPTTFAGSKEQKTTTVAKNPTGILVAETKNENGEEELYSSLQKPLIYFSKLKVVSSEHLLPWECFNSSEPEMRDTA